MRVYRGHVVQKLRGTQRLVGRKVGLVPGGHNADVECFSSVFLSVPLP